MKTLLAVMMLLLVVGGFVDGSSRSQELSDWDFLVEVQKLGIESGEGQEFGRGEDPPGERLEKRGRPRDGDDDGNSDSVGPLSVVSDSVGGRLQTMLRDLLAMFRENSPLAGKTLDEVVGAMELAPSLRTNI